jgi:hypothetical protein
MSKKDQKRKYTWVQFDEAKLFTDKQLVQKVLQRVVENGEQCYVVAYKLVKIESNLALRY